MVRQRRRESAPTRTGVARRGQCTRASTRHARFVLLSLLAPSTWAIAGVQPHSSAAFVEDQGAARQELQAPPLTGPLLQAPLTDPHPRIFLTTRGITADLVATFSRVLNQVAAGEKPTIAVIFTAMMATPQSSASALALEKVQEQVQLLSTLGARIDLIDCAHDSEETMAEVLQRSHCIYVLGGNTFYLLHHMRRSGLDELVRRRVLEQGALYVGCSAGSIVAGRSISTAFWKGWDDPAVVPSADWSEPQAIQALGLVSVSLFPHYEPVKHEALVRQRRLDLGHDVVCLSEAGGGYLVAPPASPGAAAARRSEPGCLERHAPMYHVPEASHDGCVEGCVEARRTCTAPEAAHSTGHPNAAADGPAPPGDEKSPTRAA